MKQKLVTWVVLSAVMGCGGAPAPAPEAAPAPAASASMPAAASAAASASASAPASLPAPASTSAPPSASGAPLGPLPIGGSVLVGEIVAPPSFDPKATVVAAKPHLVACYNQARQVTATLRGKLKLRINVNEAGSVVRVDAEDGGSANDLTLLSCLGDAIKALHFKKPGGMATVTVPLVFRP